MTIPPAERDPKTLRAFCERYEVELAALVCLESDDEFWQEVSRRMDYWYVQTQAIYRAVLANALDRTRADQKEWILFYRDWVLTGRLGARRERTEAARAALAEKRAEPLDEEIPLED